MEIIKNSIVDEILASELKKNDKILHKKKYWSKTNNIY